MALVLPCGRVPEVGVTYICTPTPSRYYATGEAASFQHQLWGVTTRCKEGPRGGQASPQGY